MLGKDERDSTEEEVAALEAEHEGAMRSGRAGAGVV